MRTGLLLWATAIVSSVDVGCTSNPTGITDFAAPADLSASVGDLSILSRAPDLLGLDVSCTPTSELTGGDPVDTWTVVGACADEDAFSAIAGACTSSFVGTKVTGPGDSPMPNGVVILNGNGRYMQVLHATVSTNAIISGTCAASGCATLESAIASFAPGVRASCAGDGTCTCALSYSINRSDSGLWRASGNTITSAPTNEFPQSYRFGVEAGVLRYRGDLANSAGNSGVTYVLVR